MDTTLAFHVLFEIYHELNPLTAAYINLKAAFDSVNRAALWKAVQGIGIPDIFLRLIKDLHNDQWHGCDGRSISLKGFTGDLG